MSFRRWVLLVGALCAACGSPPEEENVIDCNQPIDETNGANEMAIPPWHMWGGLVNFNATTTTPGFTFTKTQQLCRVEYHRPESWRFLFFARLLGSENHSPAIFQVDFSIIPGVGRGSLNLQPFETFKFKLPIGPLPAGAVEKWSSSVVGPVRDDTLPVPPDVPQPNVVDSFVAQDVQISVTGSVVLTVPGDTLQAEMGCLLAPWHHARPDWQLHNFSGEELGGR